jgi:acyl-coenzyme A thioesterase PaaI-like protein
MDVTLGGFQTSELTTAQVEALESYLAPLADSVRALVDATIRSTLDEKGTRLAKARIDEATALLRGSQLPGPAGVHVNAEGRSWHWGNAAAGLRNALAPPMLLEFDQAGRVSSELDLGAAYEGPPGHLHGGVAALVLDHLMGVTASAGKVPAVTGTLTLRYRRATALGRIRVEGWVDRYEGYKTYVVGRIADSDGVTVEAEGVFVRPRWARDPSIPSSPTPSHLEEP